MEIVNAIGAWIFVFLLALGAIGLFLKASKDNDKDRGSCIVLAGVILLAAALATAAITFKPEILDRMFK